MGINIKNENRIFCFVAKFDLVSLQLQNTKNFRILCRLEGILQSFSICILPIEVIQENCTTIKNLFLF